MSDTHVRRRRGAASAAALAFTLAGMAALFGAFAGCAAGYEEAGLVLVNGRIVTLDDARPEAEALAMRNGRIVAVGSTREIRRYVGPGTQVLELEGQLAVPGFVEAHGHFMGLGNAQMTLDLLDVTSWDELVSMVAAAARDAAPGAWITGRGWHQDKFVPPPPGTVEGVPTHHALSAVSPDNPVLLRHASGHAAFANAKALELAGIGRGTPDPAGGKIVRDARGEPTGYLRQAAQGLVARVQGQAEASLSAEEREARALRQIELAGAAALAHGVTSFHDAGAGFGEIERFRALAERGELPLRLYVMVNAADPATLERRLPQVRAVGVGNHFLTVRSIKARMDGALGTHGAWLLEPYADMPGTTGLPQTELATLRQVADVAIRHGFQVNTHAIGDRGNREMLDIYEAAFAAHPEQRDPRWRLEHAQHLDPADIPRFARLGVIASMQGIHATSDGPWVPERVGHERARTGAYVWRSLLDAGAVVANGTDVPVERIDPIASFHATVTRRLPDGSHFFPEQRLTREEALRSYTLAGAYAAFEEDLKGSIAPGKLADIVVLSRDILTVPDDEIRGARVVYTILDGRVVYGRDGAAEVR
jgi:predicted amidohydrolase YtcJ